MRGRDSGSGVHFMNDSACATRRLEVREALRRVVLGHGTDTEGTRSQWA